MFNLPVNSFDSSEALCAQVDPELFFPTGNGFSYINQVNEAKKICNACPIIANCLLEALQDPEVGGVWGGTTERERKTMRKSKAWMKGVVITGGKPNA